MRHKKCRAAGTGAGFTHSSFHTEELYGEPLSHREACPQGGLYTQRSRSFYPDIFFTHESYTHYTQKLLHEEIFAGALFTVPRKRYFVHVGIGVEEV